MDKASLISQEAIHQEDEKHKEEHIQAGEYLKSLVYGGLDGCINTLIIVLSGVSSNTSAAKILAFCISAVVGDSIGMGLGDYLSARSEIQFIKAE
jgi:VIT1/CCC1 family predicted Fe2+/Mn2+ transporter